MKRIVIIAPSDALPLAVTEVENLIAVLGEKYKITLFQSQVTETKLLSVLSTKCDWVWVCSHTSEEGIELSDGFIWKTASFARWLINIDAKVTFLNTCFSIQLVNDIQRYANVDVVATLDSEGLDDSEGVINAIYLAKQLVSNDLETAVQISAGNGAAQYRLFEAIKSTVTTMDENLSQKLELLTQRVLKLETLVTALERIIKGDADLQVASVQTQIALLREMYQETLGELQLIQKLLERDKNKNNYERDTIVVSPVQIAIWFLAVMLIFSIVLTILLNIGK